MDDKQIKILIAKPGLDGHDRGAKITALALRDAGMDVIYTGLHKTTEGIVNQAIQKNVDVIGLSVMTGGHMHTCEKIIDILKDKGAENIQVVVGGVIPKTDVQKLLDLGVRGVFPGGTPLEEIVNEIKKLCQ